MYAEKELLTHQTVRDVPRHGRGPLVFARTLVGASWDFPDLSASPPGLVVKKQGAALRLFLILKLSV